MKLPWKSGEITDKDAMWSTEINYGDGNGDGHGEGWSKIVKDGKRQWELVFTALSLHFHCISAFDFLSKNVPKFWLCRWTFISQKKKADHGNLRGFDILVVIIDMHGHLSLQLMDRVVWNVLSGGPQIKSKSVEKQ